MKEARLVTAALVVVALVIGLSRFESPAMGSPPKKKHPSTTKREPENKPASDPRMDTIKGNLEAVFRYWDTDRDNKVTAAELAVGFRGRDAIPYHPYTPGASSSSAASTSKNLNIKEIAWKYPDYDFLMHWDKDRDDAISADEFGGFVKEVCNHYQTIFQKMDRAEKLQKNLALKDINASRRARIQAQLDVLHTELDMAQRSFRYQLHVDHMARHAAGRKVTWSWYKFRTR